MYKKDFLKWSERLGISDVSFKSFIPQLSLPCFLKSVGYKTHALVSMPVLNQMTVLNQHFDRYELMDDFNDFGAMIEKLEFGDEPSFHLCNIGETHYPFTVKGDHVADNELLFGAKGVFRHSGDSAVADSGEAHEFDYRDGRVSEQYFFSDRMDGLRRKQIANVSHLDRLCGELFARVPPNAYVIATADHGELFGESGFFGHGPIMHPKVFEVFWLEGRIR